MPYFYFHPKNSVGQKLADNQGAHAMAYTNRAELDMRLQSLIVEAGYDLWPACHTVLGSLAGPIDKTLPLDPDNEIDRTVMKLCKASPAPWSYVKILNGPQMSCVVGYCSTPASSPYAMTASEMAQKGIIQAEYMPRPM
tara:strand:- start:399 stop:815 length:417 start_codon:yes stop_codon:yes gene_type:complete